MLIINYFVTNNFNIYAINFVENGEIIENMKRYDNHAYAI